jgi:hypothetical protein
LLRCLPRRVEHLQKKKKEKKRPKRKSQNASRTTQAALAFLLLRRHARLPSTGAAHKQTAAQHSSRPSHNTQAAAHSALQHAAAHKIKLLPHARLFCLFDAHVAKRAHARAATDIHVATQTSSLHVKSIFFHTSHDYMAVVHMDTIQGRGFGWVGGVVFMAAYTKKLQLSWMMVLVVFMLMARMMALEEHAERMLVAGSSSGLMMCNVTGFCIYLWLHVYIQVRVLAAIAYVCRTLPLRSKVKRCIDFICMCLDLGSLAR